ncbi:hypothetical protein KYG33_06800 [Chryseobacterium sp. D764]|uniref:hypothetical protein n=1 Tax=Chryseobacterium sp. D764 TaxID=2856522 RepID=UPI001C590630|nr:hypothetical protein [Chryseobacterium sp. D764]QXU50741.1 hypothetical protein KYG33_06800 [Chryseobacterium sp. D764]
MEIRIIYISEINYECYFCGNCWKIVYEGKTTNINMNNFHGYPFYIIFEHIETVSKQLTMLINKNNILLSDIFSIELILKDIIDHYQDYWLNLCLYFIIKMECLNSNIIQLLITAKNNKKFSQELRHKIRKVILLNN